MLFRSPPVNQEDLQLTLDDVIAALEANLSKAEMLGKMDAKKAGEIRKRLSSFRDKWTNNQLNEKVKQGMSKLATLLSEDKYEDAEKLQRSLNVDYPNLCTPWIIAVRQLILAQKST